MTKRLFRVMLSGAVCAALALAATTTTQAQVTITVADDASVVVVQDGSSFDSDGVVNGTFSLVPGSLAGFLPDFDFTSLTVASNLSIGGPASVADLVVAGAAQRTATTGQHTLTILATDGPYGFPTGNPKAMTVSATDTFSNTTPGDSRTFQGFFSGNPSPLLAFVPPAGTGPFSMGNPGVGTALGSRPVGYTLDNETVIALGTNLSIDLHQTDAFTGHVIITAPRSSVPEPGSLALLAVLVVPGAWFLRRRR